VRVANLATVVAPRWTCRRRCDSTLMLFVDTPPGLKPIVEAVVSTRDQRCKQLFFGGSRMPALGQPGESAVNGNGSGVEFGDGRTFHAEVLAFGLTEQVA
jgi:hypothetical protein